ncbi:hypothetical protein VD0004_g7863 [Verticillium dahliae]|uniref:Sterol 24-C-methyltransferase n=1 Tax=Verticillium dahliae TaxID=27337 RepID=A0A444RNN7_VERDA|nr:hypothetical protein VD0004_g7863 [Verticillium dahliae]PNH66726.1 hypothetical protein VD0001_g8073 [Verticillium dahliae]RXG42851.1 hypothetical protein VDGE_06572 [Verticillium dahliae]
MVSSKASILQPEDHSRDAAFNKIMHGKTAQLKGGVSAMFSKDAAAKKLAVDEYFKHFDDKSADAETAADREARVADYASLTRHYYNLATDLYEYGWCQSFHFCRFAVGEGFEKAIARHEHYLAHRMHIAEGARVLDVGCGVGGPARQIATFTGAHVTGLNNNDYQIDRATHYAAQAKMSDRLEFVKGDFMHMPFPDNSFDAVYAIEATVHASRLEGVYSEIQRVLKPGGVFGVYEWLMTDAYDNDKVEHRRVRLDIEVGSGIANMVSRKEGLVAIEAAGFELLHHEDLADRPDPLPWYGPLSGELKFTQSAMDIVKSIGMTRWGRAVGHQFMGAMETLRLAPAGTQKTAFALARASDGLVEGGKQKLFTPMYLMVGRKPAQP